MSSDIFHAVPLYDKSLMLKFDQIDCQPEFPSGWTTNPLRKIEVRTSRIKLTRSVYVAMSGGVDSSIAAALLKQKVRQYIILLTKGYNVCGVYMRNWNLGPENEYLNQCSHAEDWDDMQEVCRHLRIPFTSVYVSKESSDVGRPASRVLDTSIRSHAASISQRIYPKSRRVMQQVYQIRRVFQPHKESTYPDIFA